MERDDGLLREILARAEAMEPGESVAADALPSHDRAVVAEHMRMLAEQGYVEGTFGSFAGSDDHATIDRITAAGRAFLSSPPTGASAQEIDRALRRVEDLSNDLGRADRDTWSNGVGSLMHFVRTNAIVAAAIAPLRAVDVDAVTWFNGHGRSPDTFGGGKLLAFPVETERRAALSLRILEAVETGEVDALKLILHLYGPAKRINDNVLRLSADFVVPLIREVVYRLDEWHRNVQPAPGASGDTHYHTVITGPVGVFQAGAGASAHVSMQLAPGAGPELADILEQLRKAVADARVIPREERAQIVETIDAAVEEAKAPTPNIVKLRGYALGLGTMVQSLGAIPDAVQAVKAAMRLVGLDVPP
jgi:hypothetical protein